MLASDLQCPSCAASVRLYGQLPIWCAECGTDRSEHSLWWDRHPMNPKNRNLSNKAVRAIFDESWEQGKHGR